MLKLDFNMTITNNDLSFVFSFEGFAKRKRV